MLLQIKQLDERFLHKNDRSYMHKRNPFCIILLILYAEALLLQRLPKLLFNAGEGVVNAL